MNQDIFNGIVTGIKLGIAICFFIALHFYHKAEPQTTLLETRRWAR